MVVKYQWDIKSKVLGVACSTRIIGVLRIYKIIILRGPAHQNNSFLSWGQDGCSHFPLCGSIQYFYFKHHWTYLSYHAFLGFSSLSTAEGWYTLLPWSALGSYSASGTSLLIIYASPWSCGTQVNVHWDNQSEVILCFNQGCMFHFFLYLSPSAQVWAVSWHYAFVCISASFPPFPTYSLGFSDFLIVNYLLVPFKN